MRRLEGKVVFVAGGGGIGDVLAKRYASEGAKVVLGDLDAAAAERCAAQIAADGGEALAVELDGADEASVGAAVKQAVDRFGGLDGFHCNFADFRDGALNVGAVEIPLDMWDEIMRVNARGYLLCTRAAVPPMIERGGGVMLYTSSGAVYGGDPIRIGYTMSKSAVHALMQNVAARYGRQNIRANVIAPGLILHERLIAKGGEALKERTRKRMALKERFGRSEDIAATGAMLLSEDGAFITGQVFNVDGGATMRA